jgi:hypothetical protein
MLSAGGRCARHQPRVDALRRPRHNQAYGFELFRLLSRALKMVCAQCCFGRIALLNRVRSEPASASVLVSVLALASSAEEVR